MRIEQLTFTRFIAAITIVIFHFGLLAFPFKNEILTTLFKRSNIGVSYFFILSGFVMIIAYFKPSGEKIDVKKYFFYRFSRIYPIFILAAIGSVGCFFISSKNVKFVDLFLNLFNIHAWFPAHSLIINPPSWSLTVEFFFYAIFPFLFNKIYKNSRWQKLIFVILLIWLFTQIGINVLFYSPYYQGFPSVSHNFIFYFPLFHLNQFLIGNLAGLIYVNRLLKNKNYDVWILMIALLINLLILTKVHICLNDGLMAIFFVPFILLMASNIGFITRIFNKKIFVFLGEISYGIYILQMLVFIVCKFILKKVGIQNHEFQFYISVIALIVIASITYKYFEVPIRNWIRMKYIVSNKVENK
jgi:peptidoglycan/LPS O-acetylase OafA/YrhL